MNKLSLWNEDPWSLFREFDRLHETQNFWPATDIEETNGHFVLSVDLPGLSEKDIQVQVENNVLTISGERNRERNTEGSAGRRYERSYGKFHRSFSLPENVDSEAIEANFENGELNLLIPKSEPAKAKQIKVGSGKPNFLDRVFGREPELKAKNS